MGRMVKEPLVPDRDSISRVVRKWIDREEEIYERRGLSNLAINRRLIKDVQDLFRKS